MEFSNVQKQQLVKATQEKYALFEKAKCDLYQNVAELKSQIRSQTSRLLEALQNREVQLINQVDMIKSSKEEVLQKKLAALNCKLDKLQHTVKCSDEENYVLEDNFESLCLRDMVPEEPMHMTFKPTPIGLKDVVMNFGKITSNGVSLSTFAESDTSPTSLSKQSEDYRNVSHKAVEQTKQASNSVKSLVTSEWLAKPRKKPSLSKISTPINSKVIFAPFKTCRTADWLASPKSLSPSQNSSSVCLAELPKNASIQNWLHQIKQNHDFEDDGFEILDTEELNSDEDTDSIEIVSSSPASVNSEILKNAIGCKRTPDIDNSVWLAAKRKPMPLGRSSKTLPTFSYFKKIAAQDPSVWLVKKRSLSSSNVSTKPVTCSDHGLAKNCDIENLGDSSCVENLTKKFRELSQISKCPDPKLSTLGLSSDQLPPVSSVCKANEVCEKYSECVVQPNCGERNWFAKAFDATNNTEAVNHISQTPVFKADPKLDQFACKKDPFQPFQATFDYSFWLKKGKDKENIPQRCSNLKRDSNSFSSLYDWLSPESKKNIQVLNENKFKF
ncbi:nuclear receptor coactivator 4 [Octopus sinensis]|uniref:Nuclear receptor coactivator 4 n=1 Tax=Octopus sinensis TaxID=2607531 RepID=A0A6P7SCK3_9MOLL|nr:nuclear receptor coactivator 4 [Octopus sinensis]XP_036359147.1 nuclear receptor coactivator 4 [Octopus sinensis]